MRRLARTVAQELGSMRIQVERILMLEAVDNTLERQHMGEDQESATWLISYSFLPYFYLSLVFLLS